MKYDLERIVKTINASYPFFLSTINDGKPATRPFGGVAAADGKLVLLTEKDKKVYEQIKEDPNVEIAGVLPDDMTWIRVGGTATVSDELNLKEAVFNECPFLSLYFPDIESENLTSIVVDVNSVENYPEDYETLDLSDREKLIFLVRHAETEGNKEDVITGGSAEPLLTEAGIQAAKDRSEIFKDSSIKSVYASPQVRAFETAQLLTEDTGLEVVTDERLKERELGELDGGPMFHAPGNIFYYDLPFSETPEDLYSRVDEAIREIADGSDGDVLIVSHGAALGNWIFRHTGNDKMIFDDNLCCAVIDGNTFEFIGIGFSDEDLSAFTHRKE